MKTLKEILQLEVYEPKSPDEKRFKDKHVVVKHKDANGNGDDLFNAKNIKTVDREPKHGYNPGEDEKVYEEVEELDERQMGAGNVYAIATAQVKKKYGLKGKNVDLTDKQTVEAHALAKKIAKKMGVSLKESLDEQSLRRIRIAFKETFGKKSKGVAAEREKLKAAAKAATSPKPTEPDTTARMQQKLGNILQGPKSPNYPEKMLGPEDEGPDKRYGTGLQKGGVYKSGREYFAAQWPDGVEPKTSRPKSKSKK